MHVAKIIRHRHKTLKYINDDLKSVEDEYHWKIVFSDPQQMKEFKKWVESLGGKYEFDRMAQMQLGEVPKLKEYDREDICWCDVMTYYLHGQEYEFHSTLNPYKGEVYVKQ